MCERFYCLINPKRIKPLNSTFDLLLNYKEIIVILVLKLFKLIPSGMSSFIFNLITQNLSTIAML